MTRQIKVKNNVKIGFLFISVLTALILGLNFLKQKNFFNSPTLYYTVYSHINGLQKDSPILINGYNVGTVSNIELLKDNSGRLLVTLDIKEDLKISENSVAKIIASDIMGGKAVSIEMSKNRNYLHPGDTLRSDVEFDFMEKINSSLSPIADNISRLIVSVEGLLASFDKDVKSSISGDIPHILKNLRTTTANMSIMTNKKSKLNSILTNVNNITDSLSTSSQKMNKTISNMAEITDSLKHSKLYSAIDNANENLVTLKDILDKINNSKGTAGLLLNDRKLYDNLETLTKDLDSLVNDLKANPKKYVRFSMF